MTPLEARALEKIFTARGVDFAYLFGSKVQGRAHALSDRDVAVYFNPRFSKSQRFDLRLKLWNQLSDFWVKETIDLVDLAEAPLLLRFRAVQQGRLLFSRSERERVRFEVSAMSDYFDRQYYIRRGAGQAIAQIARQGLR